MSEHTSYRTSYSELNTLAQCERRWWYRYLAREDKGEQTAAMFRGSALHDLIGAWQQGDERPAVDRLAASWAFEGAVTDEEYEQILWLFDRYKAFYGAPDARVIATEYRVTNKLPGTNRSVLTYVDEIVQVDGGGIWAVERKSMKDWRRLDTLSVDPQVSITLWNLRHEFPTIQGVRYDAIRTHRFVGSTYTLATLKEAHPRPDDMSVEVYKLSLKDMQEALRIEEPLASSFQRIPLTRTDTEIAGAVAEMVAGVRRIQALRRGAAPVRNIGQACSYCDFQPQCWADLRFGEIQLPS